jgi:hypothetical protein
MAVQKGPFSGLLPGSRHRKGPQGVKGAEQRASEARRITPNGSLKE